MGNLDILNQNLLPTVTCHYLAANANEKLKFVKNHQNFCSNLCRCDVCVTADYAASNCTEFTIVICQCLSQHTLVSCCPLIKQCFFKLCCIHSWHWTLFKKLFVGSIQKMCHKTKKGCVTEPYFNKE